MENEAVSIFRWRSWRDKPCTHVEIHDGQHISKTNLKNKLLGRRTIHSLILLYISIGTILHFGKPTRKPKSVPLDFANKYLHEEYVVESTPQVNEFHWTSLYGVNSVSQLIKTHDHVSGSVNRALALLCLNASYGKTFLAKA